MPVLVVEIPPGLLDPEITDFAALDRVPIFFAHGAIGQAVIAKAKMLGHPRLELGHEIRHIKYSLGQKPGIFGGNRRQR